MDIDITMLGGFAVTIDDALVDPVHWRRRHAAALVKILGLEPRRTLHRERVIDMLWPDLTIKDAAPRLHKAAHYARRALGGPGTIVLAAESVTLLPHHDSPRGRPAVPGPRGSSPRRPGYCRGQPCRRRLHR